MTDCEISAFIDQIYKKAQGGSREQLGVQVPSEVRDELGVILGRAESSKGVLTVLITSLIYKKMHPKQDIRLHQSRFDGGYSGRTFDAKFVTPFMKDHQFPAMASSGWLTRSLEQHMPYDFNYPGSISPVEVKNSFLNIIAKIEGELNCEDTLEYIFIELIRQRDFHNIDLAKPTNLSINQLVNYLCEHFNHSYQSDGAARLPVLAIQAIYQCLIEEISRFQNMTLCDLESHTSADRQSGNIGDINVVDSQNHFFESIEVKHGIPITLQLVKDSYAKFMTTPVKRFYILSTVNVDRNENELIEEEIRRIKASHGCQVIANGMIKSLNYYMRLLSDPCDFIEKYALLAQDDPSLKYEHRLGWNNIVQRGGR